MEHVKRLKLHQTPTYLSYYLAITFDNRRCQTPTSFYLGLSCHDSVPFSSLTAPDWGTAISTHTIVSVELCVSVNQLRCLLRSHECGSNESYSEIQLPVATELLM